MATPIAWKELADQAEQHNDGFRAILDAIRGQLLTAPAAGREPLMQAQAQCNGIISQGFQLLAVLDRIEITSRPPTPPATG